MAKQYRLNDLDIAWSGDPNTIEDYGSTETADQILEKLNVMHPGIIFELLNASGPGGGMPNFSLTAEDPELIRTFLQEYTDGDEETFNDFSSEIEEFDDDLLTDTTGLSTMADAGDLEEGALSTLIDDDIGTEMDEVEIVDTTDGVDEFEEDALIEALEAMPSEQRDRILSRFGLQHLGTENESELDRTQADMLKKATDVGKEGKALGKLLGSDKNIKTPSNGNALAKLIGSLKY